MRKDALLLELLDLVEFFLQIYELECIPSPPPDISHNIIIVAQDFKIKIKIYCNPYSFAQNSYAPLTDI